MMGAIKTKKTAIAASTTKRKIKSSTTCGRETKKMSELKKLSRMLTESGIEAERYEIGNWTRYCPSERHGEIFRIDVFEKSEGVMMKFECDYYGPDDWQDHIDVRIETEFEIDWHTATNLNADQAREITKTVLAHQDFRPLLAKLRGEINNDQ